MDLADRPITIIGGGVAGTTAALLLARRGARVTLVERSEHPTVAGAALALAPNGLSVLYGLGLEARLRMTGACTPALPIFGEQGQLLAANRVPATLGRLGHLLLIRRARLLETLYAALADEAGATLVTGVASAALGADGSFFADGPSDPFLVLGADGARSIVRQHVDGGCRVRATGRVYVRGLVARIADAGCSEHWTASGIFGVADVDDATYFYASANHPAVWRAVEAGDLDRLRQLWAVAHPLARAVLDHVDLADLLRSEVVRVDCQRLVRDRVVLLGDAAHAMAPTAGQGANTALVDAAVLVAELDAANDRDAALAAYDRRRRRRVRSVQNLADRLAWLAEHPGARTRRWRDRALPWLIRSGQYSTDRMLRVWQEPPAALHAIAKRRT